MKRHRLILLSGILVALIFFFLGVKNWMGSQEQTVPPPVVRSTPPVQVSPPAPTTQPKPTEQQKEEKPETKVAQTTPKGEQKPKQEGVEEGKKPKPKVEQKTKGKVEKEKREAEHNYVVQIGAFKSEERAKGVLKLAKDKGFTAFLIEENGFYKVRVRVKAQDIASALGKVRGEFKSAFLVK